MSIETNVANYYTLVEFLHGSALALPFGTANFDRAYTIHAGMNIADKLGSFAKCAAWSSPRDCSPFELMRTAEGPIRYPVPWALTGETSFVAHVNDYRDTLTAAGFHVTRERHRGAFGLDLMQRMMARVAQGGLLRLFAFADG